MLAEGEVIGKSRETHTVLNQSPPLEKHNLFTTDPVLMAAVAREGADWALDELTHFGSRLGLPETIALGFKANEYTPVLKTHDRFGNRIDEIDFHPSWHSLMSMAFEHGIHNLPWQEKRGGAHVARSALLFLASQNEAGHSCPISMTFAAVPALRKQPDVADRWLPMVASRKYDPSYRPAGEKTGILIGMAMTEKQGGSDVRANTTSARPLGRGGGGEPYVVTGHKWFCSAPMSDAFLVLAQTKTGLSCFLLPRFTPEGQRNGFFIQRLKNKLGNKSNASGEVEFIEAVAYLLGEEGKGVQTIIEMVGHTRLDCAVSSAAIMRQSFAQALHHARHRRTFNRKLIEHDLMRNVLADLAVESQAATMMAMRLARSYDMIHADAREEGLKRIATAVAKYYICKRTPAFVYEALECLGGNGYVEECAMPRLFRESPLNSIWEGSGNVISLDVLRALKNEPEAIDAFIDEIETGTGYDAGLDRMIEQVGRKLRQRDVTESSARRLVEHMALAFQGVLIVKHAPGAVADAFCATRLAGDWGRFFGTLPEGTKIDEILDQNPNF